MTSTIHRTQPVPISRTKERTRVTDDSTPPNPVEDPGFDQWLLEVTATRSGARRAERLRDVAARCAHTGRSTTNPRLARYATATAALLDHLATTTDHRAEPVRIDAWAWITDTCELSYELTAHSLSLDIHPGTSPETTVSLSLDPTTTLARVLTLLHDARTAYDTQRQPGNHVRGYLPGPTSAPITCQAYARLSEHTPLTYEIDDDVVRLDFGNHNNSTTTALRLELIQPDTLLTQLHNTLTHIRTAHRHHHADGTHPRLRRGRTPLDTSTNLSPEPGPGSHIDNGGDR